MGGRWSVFGSGSFARNLGSELRQAFVSRRAARRCLLAGASTLLCLGTAQAGVFDDFEDGNDVGWTHYDPIGVGSWSFPTGGYRIQAAASPSPLTDYPGRAGSVRLEQSFSDFVVAVDIVAWDGGLTNQEVGIGARLGQLGYKTTDGYLLTLRPALGGAYFELTRLLNEVPFVQLDVAGVALTPGMPYRLVLSGSGSSLTGKLYDLDSSLAPVATLTAVDASYTTGVTGLFVNDRTPVTGNGTADASFDNFVAVVPTDDTDGDGLSDGDELALHRSNPLSTDSDGDGALDGDEVNLYGTDPAVASGFPLIGAPAALNSNAATDSGSDLDPQVATNGAGQWVAVWESLDALGGTIGSDQDILVSRSSDGGETWSAPAALNSNAATDFGWDQAPQVTTDGAGQWVAVWESNDPLGNTIGSDDDILFARSSDGGATWSAPAALNTNAATDSGSDSQPQLTTDGAGQWVAVWASSDPLGNTIGSDDDILFARSSDGGATWSAPAALNSNASSDGGGDFSPQLTTDGAGQWVAVWVSDDALGFDLDIVFARSSDGGATWSAPAALNSNAATDFGQDEAPQLTTDGAGQWVAVWVSDDALGFDLDIVFARSSDGGATWSAPAALKTSSATDDAADVSPQLTTDGAGQWVAVWMSHDDLGGTIGSDLDILFVTSGPDPDGDGVGDGVEFLLGTDRLDADVDNDGLPDGDEVYVHGTSPFVSDSDSDGLTDSVEVNTHGTDPLDADSDDDGLWDGAEVNTHGTDPNDADSDDDGLSDQAEVITHGTNPNDADSDDDGLSDQAELITHGTDPNDPDSDGDGASDASEVALGTNPLVATAFPFLGAPAALNTNAGSDTAADTLVDLAGDAAGNWVAVWQASGAFGLDSDILVARSSDGGATWTAPVALNTNAGSDSGNDANVEIATDGAGNWVAVWQSSTNLGGTIGTDFDIFVSRSTNAGATWTAPAALNSSAATDGSAGDQIPQLATDGDGSWVAVWRSTATLGGTIGSDDDILVARSTNNGATWSAVAALNSTAATDGSAIDDFPHVASDGAGSWVAVWDSNNTLGGTIGNDQDILLARSSDGGASWSAATPLNLAASDGTAGDGIPQVAADGSGTWVAVWHSSNTLGGTIGNDMDIVSARSTNGGLTWSAPIAVGSAAASDVGGDTYPHLATDGNGTWIVVWYYAANIFVSDEDILTSHSTDGGVSFATTTSLTGVTAASDYDPDVASDGAGRFVAAWQSNDDLGATIGTDNDILFSSSGADTDADGLADGVEAILGTSPSEADSDGDGLEDGDELAVYGTDPLVPDSDADCLLDGDEVGLHGTDPLDDDSDDDGLTDGTELGACSAPLAAFGALAASPATSSGTTDPLDADSDGDGIQDGTESGLTAPQGVGTNLLVFVPDADPMTTTDPANPDSDGDGLQDGAEDGDADGEVDPGETDALDPDSDDDGFSDGYELLEGTDPLDPQSVPPPIPLPGLGGWGSAALASLLLAAARRRLRPRARAD